MALPKLVGQGVSSAAGAIGKSVKTGAKAFGALGCITDGTRSSCGYKRGIKTLAGKFKGRRRRSSGDLSQLQQSVEEVPPQHPNPLFKH